MGPVRLHSVRDGEAHGEHVGCLPHSLYTAAPRGKSALTRFHARADLL